MLTEKLDKYMEKVSIINKDISKYKDLEKGICYTIPTGQLFPRVEYMELTKQELNKLKFEQKVDSLEYTQVEFDRPTPKSEVTKRDEDKFTLIDKKIKGYAVWNVSNGLNIKKSFTNKEDALKLYNDIDEKVNKFYE